MARTVLSRVVPPVVQTLRRVLPTPAFQKAMRLGQAGLGRLLPDGAALELEDVARRGLRAPTPAGNFNVLAGRDDVVDPGTNWIGPATDGTRIRCDAVICCAFQGRHEIVREIVSEIVSSDQSARIFWVLTGSGEADRAFIASLAAEWPRVTGFACPNRPLGRKWQSCVKASFDRFDADLTVITGSDDLISATLVDAILARRRAAELSGIDPIFQAAVYGTLEWSLLDTDPASPHCGGLYRCRYAAGRRQQPIGAGRFYARHFMQAVDGYLFDSRSNRLLDDMGVYKVLSLGYSPEHYDARDGIILSVKGPWRQMNSFRTLAGNRALEIGDVTLSEGRRLKATLSKRAGDYLFPDPS